MFAAAPKMETANFQMDEERRTKNFTTEAQYLNKPPEGEDLFQVC
jgi:hypothetical protein